MLKYRENVSLNLLKICRERNLTQEQAAEICGISSRYFGKIICKKPRISIDVIELICNGLNIMAEELLEWADTVDKEKKVSWKALTER